MREWHCEYLAGVHQIEFAILLSAAQATPAAQKQALDSTSRIQEPAFQCIQDRRKRNEDEVDLPL